MGTVASPSTRHSERRKGASAASKSRFSASGARSPKKVRRPVSYRAARPLRKRRRNRRDSTRTGRKKPGLQANAARQPDTWPLPSTRPYGLRGRLLAPPSKRALEGDFLRGVRRGEFLSDSSAPGPTRAALVCLVGYGQEINRGEGGLRLWGEALAREAANGNRWRVLAASPAIEGGDSRELPRKLRPDLLATAPTGNRRHNGPASTARHR